MCVCCEDSDGYVFPFLLVVLPFQYLPDRNPAHAGSIEVNKSSKLFCAFCQTKDTKEEGE